MPTRYDDLKPFATERQLEYIDAIEAKGTVGAAARHLGISERGILRALAAMKRRAARQGHSPDHDMTHTVPEGYQVRGVSTLYDQDGNPKAQWVKSQISKEQQLEAMQEAIEALCETIKPIKPTKVPKKTDSQMMSAYPVGDHHIGMLSWHEETGADWDTGIAERLLIRSMDYLVEAAPNGDTGALMLLGDFLHYDSYEAVTPQNKNLLDSDSRYPRLVRAAMHTVRYAIKRMLAKHKNVHVFVVGGNHDPSSMTFLREALSVLYEMEPRVMVDRSPALFQYLRFGKVMIGMTHGDKIKVDDFPLIMATDRPQDWGETEHRYCYTGHIHTDVLREKMGVMVETFGVLPPTDAWAAGRGYRAKRSMKRIDYHVETGEWGRQQITPQMIENED